jgi:hypothetical protein
MIGNYEMTVIHIIILALAVCRLSLLFVTEDGPMHIFKKIRDKVGIQDIVLPNGDIKKFIIDEETNLLGGILSCTWCSSVWFSAFLIIWYLLFPLTAFYISAWLSLSMISIIINVIIERLQDANKDI